MRNFSQHNNQDTVPPRTTTVACLLLVCCIIPTSKFITALAQLKINTSLQLRMYLNLLLATLVTCEVVAFSPTTNIKSTFRRQHPQANANYHATSTSLSESSVTTGFKPVFDFTGSTSKDDKEKSVASFERIDDAIMGGISLSALKDVPGEDYASWSGVCRTDGGGFCGMRTKPFKESLDANGQDGVFINCKLNSDDEPGRRMWKLTVRTDSSRGEMVYQAQFDLAEAITASRENRDDWAHVKVPFDSFQLVRGPRLIPDGPKLDVTGGIYQIGMTLSKFKMSVNTSVLEDFRPGFFDMHIQSIGFYKDQEQTETVTGSLNVPDTLSKKEAESKRPLPLKILLPVAKLLFSETANRRKSAMKILREKRKMSRAAAILFGIRNRRKRIGLIPSLFKTTSILVVDSARSVLKNVLKVVFLYPLRLFGLIVRNTKKMLGMKVKPSLRE